MNDTILKLFPTDSAKMVSELRAYEVLKPLQGSVIPEFIGVFNLDCFDGLAIAYDAVDGITIEEFFKNGEARYSILLLGMGSNSSCP